MKKSLNGFVLLAISNLYGNDERLNPAINAQISREKPIASINAADSRHRPIAKTRRNSWDCATNDTKRGNTYLISKYITPTTAPSFKINIPANDHRATLSPAPGNEESKINKSIANISCTIRIPILNLPKTSSSSPLSPSSFTIIIVLLNDKAIPINRLVITEYHNPRDSSHPNTIVNPT